MVSWSRWGITITSGGLAFAVACGPAPTDAIDPLPMNAPSPLCAMQPDSTSCTAGRLASMTATLYVSGGHVPCPLSVDPTDSSVSGLCSNITPGAIRPLVVVYALPISAQAPADAGPPGLALALGSVDLRFGSLPAREKPPTVTLELSCVDIVYEPSAFAAWAPPQADCARREPGNAAHWAWCLLTQELHVSLDCNLDGQANLIEACGAAAPPTCLGVFT